MAVDLSRLPPMAIRFLKLYSETGQGAETRSEIQKWSLRSGFAKYTYSNYFSQHPEFKAAIVEIKAMHADAPEGTYIRHKPFKKEPKHPTKNSLQGWKSIFIDTWAKTGSRVKAISDAGVRWGQVKKALVKDKYFKHQYDEVKELQMVGIEDSLMMQASTGRTTASIRALEAFNPNWSTKVKHTHEVSGNVLFTAETQKLARDTWKTITDGDIVDVEARPQLPAAK